MRSLLGLLALAASFVSQAADNEVLYLPGGKTLVVPAFRIYIATGYTPSERNLERLKELKVNATVPRLVTFDTTKNNKSMLLCRGSFPVYGPNRTPFASLIEAALNLELTGSGLSAPDAPRILGTLDEFDFSSFGSGKWMIGATFSVDGKPPVVIRQEYSYPVSAGAVGGCGDVMNALVPGIESFLLKLYSDPRFLDLVQ